ncbi:MAG TPA: hypothetical protein VF821_07420 [Lentzea sp.]
MKRWTGAVAAVVLVAVGAVVWLQPASVDVVMITAINSDGTVEWVEGEIKPAPENNSAVQAVNKNRYVAKLADDVVIRTAQGCPSHTDISLSLTGLGTVPCSREEFLALESSPYAPRLEFNGDGEITAIYGRYHP